jgi:hypothetical protein
VKSFLSAKMPPIVGISSAIGSAEDNDDDDDDADMMKLSDLALTNLRHPVSCADLLNVLWQRWSVMTLLFQNLG